MARARRGAWLLWALACSALAQAPSYDAFCEREGNITTREQAVALWAMLRQPSQLEVVYADAQKGTARARRVFQELETSYFPDIGRELAEKVSRPPCLVPLVRESSKECRPDWSFVEFLSKDKPGGAKLRKALFDGFAERARERHLENQLILSAMNALIGVGVAATVLREAEVAASASAAKAPKATSAPKVPRTPVTRPPAATRAAEGSVGKVAGVQRLKPDEIMTGDRLSAKLGIPLWESENEGAEFVDALGHTYDAVGRPLASKFWNEKEFVDSIDRHLRKSNNFTVIDLTGFTDAQKAAVSAHIKGLSAESQATIIRIGF
ncbi:MAG TPA: hypothetical protein VFU23_07735 [Gemmatimonadales bacterium]|nr:hypothetical protein [Gemmatimonadales bacterium]